MERKVFRLVNNRIFSRQIGHARRKRVFRNPSVRDETPPYICFTEVFRYFDDNPAEWLALALAGQDRLDEAWVAIETARRLKLDLSLSVIRRLRPHYHPKYLERFIDALRKAGLPE